MWLPRPKRQLLLLCSYYLKSLKAACLAYPAKIIQVMTDPHQDTRIRSCAPALYVCVEPVLAAAFGVRVRAAVDLYS